MWTSAHGSGGRRSVGHNARRHCTVAGCDSRVVALTESSDSGICWDLP
jgi:hypothetical protein